MSSPLTLPKQPTDAAVRSFGIALFALGVLFMLLVYWLYLPSPLFVAWGSALFACVATPFLWFPDRLRGVYMKCEIGLRVVAVPLVETWVLAVLYYTIFLANRTFAGRMRDGCGTGALSAWYEKRAYGSFSDESDAGAQRNTRRRTAPFGPAWQMVNLPASRWMLFLVPFMALVGFITGGENYRQQKAREDTYTLY